MGFEQNLRIMIGSRIADLRRRNNITQKAFANMLGVKSPYVSLFEAGKKPVSDEQMSKILDFFNLSEHRFLQRLILGNESNISENLLAIINHLKSISREDSEIVEGVLLSYFELQGEEKRKLLSSLKEGLSHHKARSILTMKAIKNINDLLNDKQESEFLPIDNHNLENQ